MSAALTKLFGDAGQKCAESLAKATENPWRTAGVAMSVERPNPFALELSGAAKDQYGSHFSIPGGAILVLFPSNSGYFVAAAYTRHHEESFQKMTDVVLKSLAELANIFLNPLVGHIAKAWKKPMIISSPQMQIGSQKDLLAAALSRLKDRSKLAASFRIDLASEPLMSECSVLVFIEALP
jgi:hypothetical protein